MRALPLVLTLACTQKGVGDDTVSGTDSGQEIVWADGVPLHVTPEGLPLVQGTVDGVGPLWFSIDSGTDALYLDDDVGEQLDDLSVQMAVGDVGLGEFEAHLNDLSEAESQLDVDLSGLLGRPLFQGRGVALDYAAEQLHVGPWLPEGRPAGSSTGPFTFELELQGGVPIARVGIGTRHDVPLIADTASGLTILTESHFRSIPGHSELPQVTGYVWTTSQGIDTAFVTRIPELVVGEHIAQGVWAVIVPDAHHLARLFELTGLDAEGFLGAAFWREHGVGLEDDTVSLWPYDAPQADPLEWTRVGVELVRRDGQVLIDMVLQPSDAFDQGLQVGDALLAIDGQPTEGATLETLRRALRGEDGETRALELDRVGQLISAQVRVDGLL